MKQHSMKIRPELLETSFSVDINSTFDFHLLMTWLEENTEYMWGSYDSTCEPDLPTKFDFEREFRNFRGYDYIHEYIKAIYLSRHGDISYCDRPDPESYMFIEIWERS